VNIEIILKEILGCKIVACSRLAADRDQWWAVTNTVIKLRL